MFKFANKETKTDGLFMTVRRLLVSTGGEWRAALFFIGLSIKAESTKRTGRGTGSLTLNDGHGEN